MRRSSWRKYQIRIKRKVMLISFVRKMFNYSPWCLILCLLVSGMIGKVGWAVFNPVKSERHEDVSYKDETPRPDAADVEITDKQDVQTVLSGKTFLNLKEKSFHMVSEGRRFHVTTTIEPDLQNFILNIMDPSVARYIGIIAMEPFTGKILAMTGFDKMSDSNNPCVNSQFPAASVFKIITAAAAIEKCGFNSDSEIAYSGGKYTLYKSQLQKSTQRRTQRISFENSFADSVNPVFGKIGIHYVGKTNLEEYAQAFGFNRHINFDIPLSPSTFSIMDDPYHWAEIASGFNRQTTISPLHGAIIASAILNKGMLVEPVIIDEIRNQTDQLLYQSHFTPMNQAISKKSAEIIHKLMNATVESGTCRKFFKNYHKDEVLSDLYIGAKSGSISNSEHTTKYDWFVGFAEKKDNSKTIVLSIVVAHENFIGTRAGKYARRIMEHYFKDEE